MRHRRTSPTTILLSAALFSLAIGSLSCRVRSVVDPTAVGLQPAGLDAVRARLQELVDEKKIAGAVGLISRGGKTAWIEAVGLQDIEDGTPMRTDTIFRICSMTKPITSVGVLMLVEDGKISLHDPVSRFIPEFDGVKVVVKKTVDADGDKDDGAESDPYELVVAAQPITITHLLTHTSGLSYGFLGDPYLTPLYADAGVSDGLTETPGTIGDNARKLARLPLAFQPGAKWQYSLATDVLGRVIEVASGRTLDEFFSERIFKPLGMRDTHFRLPASKLPRLAEVYTQAEDGTITELPGGTVQTGSAVHSKSYPYAEGNAFYSGGAGLVSTVEDYARFLAMLLGDGQVDGVRLLESETIANMTRNHCAEYDGLFENHGDGFGLGVGVVTKEFEDKGLGSVGTFSWGGFYYTYFWVDPQQELIGVVMAQLYPWEGVTMWDDYRKLTYEAVGSTASN